MKELKKLSLSDFVDELASDSVAPGGGSAAALAGALSASLSAMVGNLTYEKKGWAYTDNAFRLIYFDSNKKPENKVVLNPIDTLADHNSFSGNYATNAKNFIALRDNGSPNKYQFFMHFEKKDGDCVGELKGILNFNKNMATYREKGDPCIIHFTIQGNNISIKEDGNCGNHRGITCYFNDNFTRKKKAKKKK